MILDLQLSPDKMFLFSTSSDRDARSWLLELSKEAKVFDGANGTLSSMLVMGNICKYVGAKIALTTVKKKIENKMVAIAIFCIPADYSKVLRFFIFFFLMYLKERGTPLVFSNAD